MTEVMMFTGKGGVGKTTCSAATALGLALSGTRTLAVSTDGMPSLRHIYDIPAGENTLKELPGLDISEIGEAEIREMWDRKFGHEVYEVFSAFVDIEYPDFVEFMTSILPGLGEEFMADHIRELAAASEYGAIIWDTAPLCQTLALLKTPALLGEHLRLAPRIYSRLKTSKRSRQPVLDILNRWEGLSQLNMEFLKTGVSLTMVTIPEALAVPQLEGVFRELGKYGLSVKRIIVNNVVKFEESRFLQTRAAQQRPYLHHLHKNYAHLQITEIPMFPQEVKGAARLKATAKYLMS